MMTIMMMIKYYWWATKTQKDGWNSKNIKMASTIGFDSGKLLPNKLMTTMIQFLNPFLVFLCHLFIAVLSRLKMLPILFFFHFNFPSLLPLFFFFFVLAVHHMWPIHIKLAKKKKKRKERKIEKVKKSIHLYSH